MSELRQLADDLRADEPCSSHNYERWTISTDGGSQPRWSRDGRELLYLQNDGTLMSVPTQTAPSFVKSTPVPLFKTRLTTAVNPYRSSYIPTTDGQRLLIITRSAAKTGLPSLSS